MLYEETFILPAAPPFKLDLTVWTLRRRSKNIIDQWDGQFYRRVFAMGDKILQVIVKQQTEKELLVIIKSGKEIESIQPEVADRLKITLGIEKNLSNFYQLSRQDKYLKPLAKAFRGVKPPRFATLFEALLNAISCQQVTLDLGILLLNRLAENYGQKFEDAKGIQYAFPRPEDLRSVPEDEIKKLGFSYQKARAIKDLVKALLSEDTLFSGLENMTDEEIVIFLSNLRGIGRWSSEYVLLRGLGRLNVFPGDDVGAQKNLQQLLGLGKRPSYEEIKHITARWQPYAGLVYFHLLLDKLQRKNLL
jgi:DNA-3-methyladenine glycosylase II